MIKYIIASIVGVGAYLTFPLIPVTYVVSLRGPMIEHRYILSTALAIADENDTVVIEINSPGGYAHEGYYLANKVEECKGTVIAINSSRTSSAAALVAFSADQLVIKKHSLFLLHMPYIIGPHGSRLVNKEGADYTIMKQHLEEKVFKYLTKYEVDYILEGGDIQLTGPEMQKRINKVRAKEWVKSLKSPPKSSGLMGIGK